MKALYRLLSHLTIYLRALLSSGPNYLIFFITGRCNLRCAHCFYLDEIESADKKRELTLEEIKKIARNIDNLYHITITGGEPFLRKDINEVVQYFYQYSHTRSLTVTTNGTYPKRVAEKVAEIAQSCPLLIVRIPLSIDGTEFVHDEMRGLPGTWKKVVQTYELLHTVSEQYANVKLDVTSVLTQANVGDMNNLIDFVKTNMTVENHAINFPRGAIREAQEIVPAEKNYSRFVNESKKLRRPDKFRFPIFSRILITMRTLTESVILEVQKTGRMPFICQAGTKLIELNEYGELFPCEVLDTLIDNNETRLNPDFADSKMGNVRDHNYDIAKALDTDKAKRVKSFIERDGCACTFECAIGASLVFQPTNNVRIGYRHLKSMFATDV